ncbi:MFS transporter [Blastococcus sp. SYSU D00813]
MSAPAPANVRVQRRTLTLAAASTVLVLVTFVTPLATGVRTAAALDSGLGAQAWALSAMSVGLAATLLTAGVLADDLGRRRVFTAGLGVLAAGAVVAGAAGSAGLFIAGRVVQGVGGAAVLAAALGLIGATFPAGPARARAAAVWGASVGAGTGVGGVAAVVLDPGDGWRVTYLVTAATAAVLAAAAARLLGESGGRAGRAVDVAGVVLLAGGTSAVLAGLVEGRAGWGRPPVVVLLVAGALALAGFVAVERRVRAPMLDLRLFGARGFTSATVGAAVTGATVIGLSSYLPTVLQRGLGESLLAATLLVLVWSVVGTATALAVRWVPGVDGGVLLAAALAVSAAGLAVLAVLGPGATSARLLPGMVVLGIGYGAANAALGREAVAHVPPEAAGMGSGANNTARYLGAAVGVTVVVLVVGAGEPGGSAAGLLSGWNTAALLGAATALAGALVVAVLRPRRPAGGQAPAGPSAAGVSSGATIAST